MSEPEVGSITATLKRFQSGDAAARNELLARLAVQMQPIARRLMGQEAVGHTLQPTALVNEAVARLIDQNVLGAAPNRAYLFGVAARAMRQILVDHARADGAEKRGGAAQRVPLAEVPQNPTAAFGLIELNDAIEALSVVNERAGHVVTLRYLAGYTMPEVANVLGVAVSTAEADWRFARAWLLRALDARAKKSDSDQGT